MVESDVSGGRQMSILSAIVQGLGLAILIVNAFVMIFSDRDATALSIANCALGFGLIFIGG